MESFVDSLTLDAEALFSPKSSADTTGLPSSVSANEAVVSRVSSSKAAAGTAVAAVDFPFNGGTPPEKMSHFYIPSHKIPLKILCTQFMVQICHFKRFYEFFPRQLTT